MKLKTTRCVAPWCFLVCGVHFGVAGRFLVCGVHFQVPQDRSATASMCIPSDVVTAPNFVVTESKGTGASGL